MTLLDRPPSPLLPDLGGSPIPSPVLPIRPQLDWANTYDRPEETDLPDIEGFGPYPDACDRRSDVDPHDPEFFWVAPEEDMPHLIPHSKSSRYQMDALTAELAEQGRHWWVLEDLPCAWDPRDPQAVVCPDVMVGEPPPPEGFEIYRQGQHGQLRFVAEIGSRGSAGRDQGPKTLRYAARLRPDEYLYFNPRTNRLRLFRWDGAKYVLDGPARPSWATGPEWEAVRHWAWSQVLELWFAAMGQHELRAFDRSGRRLESFQETAVRETLHAAQEAARAEQEATRADHEAAHAARETARAEQEAARAAQEAARADHAERLAAERQARLEELERRLAALEAGGV